LKVAALQKEGQLNYINALTMKKHMQTAGLFKEYTMQSLIDRLDVFECFEHSNQTLKTGEMTEKQKQLYKALDINPPQT
jgi:hypothetical protein